MDLDFTPEQQAFRADIRSWVAANLPADIAHKVHNGLRQTRDDLQRWARILGSKGWLGYGWPKEFGPVMVAPVIMAFGSPEQQKRFLPGIASGEVWWSQGYSEPGSGSDLASVKTRAIRALRLR